MAGLLLTAVTVLATSALAVPNPKQASRQASSDTTTSGNVTLVPVTVTSDDVDTFTPSVNATLPYGSDSSFVNVALTSSYGNVLLETLSSVASVECAAGSVSIVFDSLDDLDTAYGEWSAHPHLLLITNHMGDCDSELERGFFTASSYTTDADSLTLVASAEKSDISSVACKDLILLRVDIKTKKTRC